MASSTYSFSRVTCFEQCPKRYNYRYNQGFKEAYDSIEAYVGKRVHDGVQWLYAERDQKRCVHSLEEIIEIYRRGWLSAPENLKIVRRGDTRESYQAIGEAMLRRYYPRFLADKFQTIAIEKMVKYQIAQKYGFIGFIDRLAKDENDAVWIIDYKTGKSVPNSFEGKDADQLRTYACGMLRSLSVDHIGLRIEYLRADLAHAGAMTRAAMEEFEAGFATRIAATKADAYPASPSALCNWCGFLDICPEGQK